MLLELLIEEFKTEAENTRKVFNAITEDVLSYAPNDFNWNIAELASHIAEGFIWWRPTLDHDELDMSTYKYEKGDIFNIQNLRDKLEENIKDAQEVLEGFDEDKLFENWSMTMNGSTLMPPTPRIRVIRTYLMNHLYHHRGELIAHLRANKKRVPGLYGPTYEENQGVGS